MGAIPGGLNLPVVPAKPLNAMKKPPVGGLVLLDLGLLKSSPILLSQIFDHVIAGVGNLH